MLTLKERLQIKKICHLSNITATDIWACVNCYRNMIDSNDYHKATIIKYVLYTIMKQNANNGIIFRKAKNAISEINSYAKLFAYED